MVKGLIFDFDGLILDTETPIFQAWQEIFERHGCTLTLETWADCIGRAQDAFDPCDHLETCLGHPIDRGQICSEEQKRETELIRNQSVLPGVRELITASKRLGLKLGVASSSQKEWVIGHLARLGLAEPFEGICCADDVDSAKPAPDLYLAVVDALGLQPDQVIAFEDSPNGVKAAKRAGVLCVAVPNALTRQLSFDHAADLTLASLEEVTLEELLRTAKSAHVGEA